MNWRTRVKVKDLLNDDESPDAVRATMAAIADRLEAAPQFRAFDTARFRNIPDGDDVVSEQDYANRLLSRMYDYADENRIWME